MACPADFPNVAVPGHPKVRVLSCSVNRPQCNGGAGFYIGTTTGTAKPSYSTATPKRLLDYAVATANPTATPDASGASASALAMAAVGMCVATMQWA
ncbi:hypothetical protein H257_16213 [Aphanomyces astaci]|uniref:Uncharacterized protein n=1 Tax=Aphanomyces astaci TaxID=112090 RepID=W4FL69_APHAT|nr:hypothetical protein H257_16213 [Aphanomyces astaci]ETV67616.1 hypothetical protein H257_16213 [Aphanomyces astaci]|eukprot:XP_009842873.1 hypothetical protein H257_16213 [Aphanomyces astaci]